MIRTDSTFWQDKDDGIRKHHIERMKLLYNAILEDLLKASEVCVSKFILSDKMYVRWRLTFIIASGGLAITNVVLAYMEIGTAKTYELPLIAAIYATILAILSNLESLYSFYRQAQSYRDAREIFLDAYREGDMFWRTRVEPFGLEPQACLNAEELVEDIVLKETSLRAKLKEITVRPEPSR